MDFVHGAEKSQTQLSDFHYLDQVQLNMWSLCVVLFSWRLILNAVL